MYEQPPNLPFISLRHIKPIAVELLNIQRTANTPESEFQNFEPSQDDKKKPKSSKACDFCKKKKVKCDINHIPPDKCTRTTCQCAYHINDNNDQDNNADDMNAIPATNAFRDPGLTLSGHFTGETSYLPSTEQPCVIAEEQEDGEDLIPPPPSATKVAAEPLLTIQDRLALIDIYYDNMNPFFPFISKRILLTELEKVFSLRKSHLSPLFFYALFARAASLANDKIRLSSNKHIRDVGTECFEYAAALVNDYRYKSRVSTILALVIMTNHLEQEKRYSDLTRLWFWAGDAFRMALDLGIHRELTVNEDTYMGQLGIRAFWLAFITDSTISMTYGRPSCIEEKALDTQPPKKLSGDDDQVASKWVSELCVLIELSKATNRIIRFNYSPPPKYKVSGPIRRQNGFLVSYDAWLCETMQPKQVESPISSQPNQIIMTDTLISRRLEFQKSILLYTNLLLLHRPHVNDVIMEKNAKKTYSYSICSYAAVIITGLANNLSSDDLNYHARGPILVYALEKAVRIHILNATKPDAEKYNAAVNYQTCLSILCRLPQLQDKSTIVTDVIQDIKRQAENNFHLAKLREQNLHIAQKTQQQQRLNQPVLTASQVVFSPSTIKEDATLSNDVVNFEIPRVGISETTTPLRFVERGVRRKGKRPPPPTDNPGKKPRKQKQKASASKEHVSLPHDLTESALHQPQPQQQHRHFHFYHSPNQILNQSQQQQEAPQPIEQQQQHQQLPLFEEQHLEQQQQQQHQQQLPLFGGEALEQQQPVNYHFMHHQEQPPPTMQTDFDSYFVNDDLSSILNDLQAFFNQQSTLGLPPNEAE